MKGCQAHMENVMNRITLYGRRLMAFALAALLTG